MVSVRLAEIGDWFRMVRDYLHQGTEDRSVIGPVIKCQDRRCLVAEIMEILSSIYCYTVKSI